MPGKWKPHKKGLEQRKEIDRFGFFLSPCLSPAICLNPHSGVGCGWNSVGRSLRAEKISCHHSWEGFISLHVLGHGRAGGTWINHGLFDRLGKNLGLGQSGLARAGSQGGSDVTNTPFSSACLQFPPREPLGCRDTPQLCGFSVWLCVPMWGAVHTESVLCRFVLGLGGAGQSHQSGICPCDPHSPVKSRWTVLDDINHGSFMEHLLCACIVLSPGELAGNKRQGPCLMDSLLMRDIDCKQTRNYGVIQGSKCSGSRRSEGPEKEGGGWFGSDVGNFR